MDKQKKIFEKLAFGPFLANLAAILFLPRKEEGDVLYASSNYKVQEPNYTHPDVRRSHFEHDVIMTVVQCGERADKGRSRCKIISKYVVSIEIKTSLEDIWKSSIDKYLGATRLFFIAAPKALLPQLIMKYRSHPRKEVIGLIDADAGKIVVLPQYQDYQKDRCDRLLARCYSSEHRYPFCCSDVELYGIHRIRESCASAPDWVDFDGIRVNIAYLHLFRV